MSFIQTTLRQQSYLAQAKEKNIFVHISLSFLMFRFWQVAIANACLCPKAAEHTHHTQISAKITK